MHRLLFHCLSLLYFVRLAAKRGQPREDGLDLVDIRRGRAVGVREMMAQVIKGVLGDFVRAFRHHGIHLKVGEGQLRILPAAMDTD